MLTGKALFNTLLAELNEMGLPGMSSTLDEMYRSPNFLELDPLMAIANLVEPEYARVLREWKLRYAPQSSDETVHARFTEACHKLDETEYYLDILCAGNSHERAEVVQQQMADGKLDRLQRRLEEIHKEELEDGYDSAGVA